MGPGHRQSAGTAARRWVVLALLGCLGLAAGGRASAQILARRPVSEQWTEILSVSPQWIVLQNKDGQQFPVAVDSIRLFLVRWPTTLDRISPTALAEVTGPDRGSNQIVTGHVDIYEGGAQGLVTPGLLYITNDGQVLRPIDFLFNEGVYGAAFPGFDAPIQGNVTSGRQLTHLVGPVVNRFPLRVAFQGTNFYTVLPWSPAGFTMSQITAGSISLARPGDLVYIAALQARPDTLVLDQFVIYKPMPIDQFVP